MGSMGRKPESRNNNIRYSQEQIAHQNYMACVLSKKASENEESFPEGGDILTNLKDKLEQKIRKA